MVKEMGFESVEGGVFHNMTAAESKKLLDEIGLKAVSSGASFSELGDPTKLSTIIQNAKGLGSEFVMCAWIDHKGDEFTIDDAKKAVTVFNIAGKVLRKAGLKLLYHPHGFEFRTYEGGFLLDYIIKNTNSKDVNYEMDIYWIKNPGQDPVAWMKKYPTRWKTMHMKDQKKGTPGDQNGHSDVEWNVIVGEGNQDMPAVMAEAKKIGIKYYFIEDESSRSVEQTPKSAAYLKTFLMK
jgi:sugar phosphate isomerase/epimerase